MGLFRKSMSIRTLGLVSYRSKSEKRKIAAKKEAKAARQADRASRAQAQEVRAAQVQRARVAQVQQVQRRVPPGWYIDPTDNRAACWWDGSTWHPQTKRYLGQAPQAVE